MSIRLRNRFIPVLDHLEHRNLLAGNVTASLSHGILQLTGDLEANQISIASDGNKGITISAPDDTTINGSAQTLTFTKVKGLSVNLGDGDDVLTLSGFSMNSSVNLDLGAGDDTLAMTGVKFGGKSAIALGDGDDTADFSGSSWGERVQFQGGLGADTLTMNNVKGGERTTIDLGDDNDVATISNSSFKERFTFQAGAGDDSVTMTNIKGGERTTIDLGDGNDTAVITDSAFKERFTLQAGDGDDRASFGTTSFKERTLLDGGTGTDALGMSGNTFKNKRTDIINWESQTVGLLPTAADDTAAVATGGMVVIDVAANDIALSGVIDLNSIVIVTQPISGTVVVNNDGTVTYTHDGSASTSDSFQYTIRNGFGGVSNVATVNITIGATA